MKRCLLRVTLAAIGVLLLAVAPATAGDLRKAQRDTDPRLARTVSYAATQVYVGELLEELSRQTGVSVKTGDSRDGAADFRVTLSLSRVPLGDAMSALWSLMSYQGAEWDWNRRDTPDGIRYELLRPQPARAFPNRMGELAESVFESYAQRMLKAAAASPDERAQMDDPIIRQLRGEDRVWNGIRTFAENVPAEKQLRVLRGEPLRVPFDQLTATGKAYVMNEIAVNNQARQKFGLPPSTDPLPTWVAFTRGGSSFATPSLFLILEGRGGNAAFGGVPLGKQFNDRLRELWLLPGDTESDALESRVIPAPQPVASTTPAERPTLLMRLSQAGKAAPFSFLALLPTRSQDPGSPYGQTVAKFLEEAHGIGSSLSQHKWRGGILLVNHPTWFYNALGNPPWAVMQQLRVAEKRNNGVLTVPDLWVTADLAPGQQQEVARTFPEVASVGDWELFLMAIHKQPELWRGLMTPRGISARALLPLLSDQIRAQLGQLDGVSYFRVLEEDQLDADRPNRVYHFQAYSQDRKALNRVDWLLVGPPLHPQR